MGFKCGQKVNVKLDAEGVVSYVNNDGSVDVDVEVDDGTMSLEYVSPGLVTPVEPSDWPPAAGQVWRAGGKLYGVRRHSLSPSEVVVFPIGENGILSYANPFSSDNKLDDFKALQPELVASPE